MYPSPKTEQGSKLAATFQFHTQEAWQSIKYATVLVQAICKLSISFDYQTAITDITTSSLVHGTPWGLAAMPPDPLEHTLRPDTDNNTRRIIVHRTETSGGAEGENAYANGRRNLEEEECPDDLIQKIPSRADRLSESDLDESGKCSEVPADYRLNLGSSSSMDAKSGSESPLGPSGASSAIYRHQRKRSHGEIEEAGIIPLKKAKAIRFHPDTDDNWRWSTNRVLERPISPSSNGGVYGYAVPQRAMARPITTPYSAADDRACSNKAVLNSPPPVLPEVDRPRASPPVELRLAAEYGDEARATSVSSRFKDGSTPSSSFVDSLNQSSSSTPSDLSSSNPFVTPEPGEVKRAYMTHMGEQLKTCVLFQASKDEFAVAMLNHGADVRLSPRKRPQTVDAIDEPTLIKELESKLEPQVGQALERWIFSRCEKAWEAGFQHGFKTERVQRTNVARLATMNGGVSRRSSHPDLSNGISKPAMIVK